jgi:hypothetical protein
VMPAQGGFRRRNPPTASAALPRGGFTLR